MPFPHFCWDSLFFLFFLSLGKEPSLPPPLSSIILLCMCAYCCIPRPGLLACKGFRTLLEAFFVLHGKMKKLLEVSLVMIELARSYQRAFLENPKTIFYNLVLFIACFVLKW